VLRSVRDSVAHQAKGIACLASRSAKKVCLCCNESVSVRLVLGLAVVCVSLSAGEFILGVDFSEWLPANITHLETDSSGALYLLSPASDVFGAPPSLITKLSGDGRTIFWQNDVKFAVDTFAVSPNGAVFLVPTWQPGDAFTYVAKLNDNGIGLAWKTAIGSILPGYPAALAADVQDRAYIAAACDPNLLTTCVIRLNTSGAATDYTAKVQGAASSMAVDGLGTAFVAGYRQETGGTRSFLASLSPSGAPGFYSSTLDASSAEDSATVAVTANGEPVVLYSRAADFVGVLQRFDPTGAVALSQDLADVPTQHPIFAVDATGNAYVYGQSDRLHPVKNSLATCGTDWISVYGPDGSLLQTTYIPAGENAFLASSIAPGPNSTVYLGALPGANFTPSQIGPFPSGGLETSVLLRLSLNTKSPVLPLVCAGNAASYSIGSISPGELVTLFGNALGPIQGVQGKASARSPYPTTLADVEVTFGGKPAPLLWVQDLQVNAIAPWSLVPGQATEVCLSWKGSKTNCLNLAILASASGVFTTDGVHAAALNQDGTVNSADRPAAPGSIVAIFATGLGPIKPAQDDGTLVEFPLPANVLGVEVFDLEQSPAGPQQIPLEVTYAGPAPYQVAGVSQVNFRIPKGSGHILLTVEGQSTVFQVYLDQ